MPANLNFEPLREYLTEEIRPRELSLLLDDVIFEHMRLLICTTIQQRGEDLFMHQRTDDFYYHLRRLRDLFAECEKVDR